VAVPFSAQVCGREEDRPEMLLRNRFLSAADTTDLEALSPHLREVWLDEGQWLSRANAALDQVYFPSSAVVALMLHSPDHGPVEIFSVGCESAVGLASALAEAPPAGRPTVRIPGGALAMPADVFRATVLQRPRLLHHALRFLQADFARSQCDSGCWALHALSARLARCLLTSQDRVDKGTIHVTQDGMAMMTHALRGSVSHAAGELKQAGLIRYSRGQVEIVNRPGLEAAACRCYRLDLERREALEPLRRAG
jgi:CRP-like cAMP-binding protein